MMANYWMKTERQLWNDRYVRQFPGHDRMEVIGCILTLRMLIECEGDGEYTYIALLLRMEEYHKVTLAKKLLSDSGYFQVDQDGLVTLTSKSFARDAHINAREYAREYAHNDARNDAHNDTHAPVLEFKRKDQMRIDNNNYDPLLSSLSLRPGQNLSQEPTRAKPHHAESPALYRSYQDYLSQVPYYPAVSPAGQRNAPEGSEHPWNARGLRAPDRAHRGQEPQLWQHHPTGLSNASCATKPTIASQKSYPPSS